MLVNIKRSVPKKEVVMFNQICVVGELTNKPELRYTKEGIAALNFSLSVGRKGQNETARDVNKSDSQKNYVCDVFHFTAWSNLAEIYSSKLELGAILLVVGRLNIRRSITNNKVQPEIIVSDIRIIASKTNPKGNPDNVKETVR